MIEVGVVIIGRNEGERLRRCLASVAGRAGAVVYVDSGSTDGSVAHARSAGAEVVVLDLSRPFTAARARNAGFERLEQVAPSLRYVQFVDGDCEVVDGWIELAARELDAQPDVAVVCGRQRERFPERSVYNRLADIEWDTPVGEARACGGVAMMRAESFRRAGGFDPALIAGEEPELCLRLRRQGGRILRLDAEMALHDMAMTRFGPWWRRAVRAGHAYAEGAAMHGASPQRHWVRESRSIAFWGLLLPLAVLVAAWPTRGGSLLLLAGYPLLVGKIYRASRRRGFARGDAGVYAVACVVAKFAQAQGLLRFWAGRLSGSRSRLIEYKGARRVESSDTTVKSIAYLINQYPAPSQTFIRREIEGLEALDVRVGRYTLRPWSGPLVDESDRAEQQRTRAVLGVGALGLLAATLRTAATSPIRFARAAGLALRVGSASERGVLIHLIYLAEACVLRGWLRRDGVDHVHAHFGTNSTTVAMLCRVLGGPPYSFTVHGPEEFDMPRALALGEKVARSAFVVAISQFGRSQLYRWCEPSQWPKVQVVRCGVDAEFLHAADGPFPTAPRLVCVGRLAEQKGQLVLIEAAARLKERGLDFEVVLAGDGPMRPVVERLIADHGLERQIRLAGWMSNAEVRRAVLDSRAMVLPSFAEGLPVVLMEALALGRPVISTYVAGIPELVEDGTCGWLVPASSVDELARAMQEALEAPVDRLAAMGRVGARRVAERHDVAREAAALARLFLTPPSGSA